MVGHTTKGNLLIIDDEVLLTESIELLMEPHTDHTFVANNGESALKILKDQEIHCIVCDINMPGMSGVDVIKKARAQGHEQPFIFYTAYGNEQLMMEAVKYEAFDFLDKPNLDGLVEVVTRGLKKGLTGQDSPPEQDAFMSEFQTLLGELQKK